MSTAYLKAELLRILRNKRTVFFTVVMPVLFFLLFAQSTGSPSHGKVYAGLSVEAYYMVGMASYAATNALFTAGGRISVERKAGWNRQLRLAGVSGGTYLTTKVLLAYASALPGFVAVLVLASTTRGVDLPALRWVELLVSVLLALAPVAALGVLVGYVAGPDSLQPIFGFGTFLLAMVGGMLIPIGVFNDTLQTIFKLLPTYWTTFAGRQALAGDWVGWHGLGVLVGWTVGFGLLAARAYQRDTTK
ncbi:MAG: type transporter [Frankiales bacterium]|nr:type transporter [Frankiales bacterium]